MYAHDYDDIITNCKYLMTCKSKSYPNDKGIQRVLLYKMGKNEMIRQIIYSTTYLTFLKKNYYLYDALTREYQQKPQLIASFHCFL